VPDPLLLPIDNVYILNVFYHARTKMIQIHCVLPEDRSSDDSDSNLYKFMYTVDDGKEQEAESFCKHVMTQVYKDLTREKRIKVLINPFGGQAKAKEIFEYQVRPVFESAKCKLDVQRKAKIDVY
jgi:sphingosine kinase